MSALSFRRATVDDLYTLAELERSSFRESWPLAAIREELERSVGWTALASRGEVPVAYACFLVASDEIELLRIAVAPEHRREGAGRELLEWGLAALGERGASQCFLEVRSDNDGAIAFYRELGFRRAGERRFYYADGCDALLFRVSLDRWRERFRGTCLTTLLHPGITES